MTRKTGKQNKQNKIEFLEIEKNTILHRELVIYMTDLKQQSKKEI